MVVQDQQRGPGRMCASCLTREDAHLRCASSGTCAQSVVGGTPQFHACGRLRKAHREPDGVDPALGLRRELQKTGNCS